MVSNNLYKESELPELILQVRREKPATELLYLNFEDCRIKVMSNDAMLTAELKKYFNPFVGTPADTHITITVHESKPLRLSYPLVFKQPDPGKKKIKEATFDLPGGRIVYKRLTGMVFLFGSGEHLAIGPCRANSNQIVNFINNRFIEWMLEQGGLLGHAAAVHHRGRGLALAGFSGRGKSTLALHLLSKGADFISNDRLVIRKQRDRLHMYGVAKLPRINPGTALSNPDLAALLSESDRKRFSMLSKQELWNIEHKYDVPITEIFDKADFRISSPLNSLVILNWHHDQGPVTCAEVNLYERNDLLEAFMKPTGLFYLPRTTQNEIAPTKKQYLDHLRNATVYEFYGGVDFDQASRLCMGFLEK